MTEFDTSLRTERFVDADFTAWYDQGSPLVGQAAVELPDTLYGFEGQELPGFEAVLSQALIDAHDPRNEYHGLLHAQRVTENAYDAYEALQGIHDIQIPDAYLQAVLVGTATHDHGHPGTSFFADADPGRIPADADADMAVEFYSARLAAERLHRLGACAGQQAVAAYIPAASAYGEHYAQGKRLGLARASHPKGISGLMMRAVDVVPLAGDDYAVVVAENTAILLGEKPPAGHRAPETVHEVHDRQAGFLNGYVLPTFDALDQAVQAPLSEAMGWRERVRQRLTENDELIKDGFSLRRVMLQAQAQAKYNRSL